MIFANRLLRGRVPVSTTETAVPKRLLGLDTICGETPSEKECLRVLVHRYGWHWLEAGVLARPWSRREVA